MNEVRLTSRQCRAENVRCGLSTFAFTVFAVVDEFCDHRIQIVQRSA